MFQLILSHPPTTPNDICIRTNVLHIFKPKNEHLQKPISIKIWTNAHDCNQPMRLVKRPNIGNES